MEIPDFYSVISQQQDKMVGFHQGLLDLFDHMLNEAGITDQATLDALVFSRSRIDIILNQLQ